MNHHRYLGLASTLFAIGLTLLLGARNANASCVPETNAQLFLDPSTFPNGELDVAITTIELPSAGAHTFGPVSGSVTGIQIAGAQMLSPSDAYLPNVDYFACLENGDGSGVAQFLSEGVYLVQVDYSAGPAQYFVVGVAAKQLTQCFKDGDVKEFPCPAPPKAYEGADVAVPPDFPVQSSVSGIDDLVTQVTTDAAGGPISLVFVDHGCQGQFTINGTDRVSLAAADSTNLRKLCNLKGKIASLTLLSCSTGNGAPGAAFLQALANCLNAPVTGFSGNVRSWNRKGKRVWGSFGSAVTKNMQATPAERPTWGRLKSIYH